MIGSCLTQITGAVRRGGRSAVVRTRPSLVVYLIRDSLQRWGGRGSVPFARLIVAVGLSSAALLVLASFALGMATLENRIAQFGLDSLVIRTPLRRATDPAPRTVQLSHYGRLLALTLPYASVTLDTGRQVPLALASDSTLREFANLGISATGCRC